MYKKVQEIIKQYYISIIVFVASLCLVVGIGLANNRKTVYNPRGTYIVHPMYIIVLEGESRFSHMFSNEGDFLIYEKGLKTITGKYSVVLDSQGERTQAIHLAHDGGEFYIIREYKDKAYMLKDGMRIEIPEVNYQTTYFKQPDEY